MISRTNAAHAVALALLASFANSAMAQTEAQPKCVMQNIATLTLHDDGLTISADGKINSDAVPMLIDSGAPNTMVTKAESIKLGLVTPEASGTGKKAAADDRVPLTTFAVGPIAMSDVHIHASQKLSDYPAFGALVGADLLMQHDMELALGVHQLKFFNPVGCNDRHIAYWDKNAVMLPMATLSATDHRPVVTVEVDGQSLRAMIDTGSPVSVMSLSAAARAGVTPKSPGVKPMKSATPGAKSTSWVAPFHQFSIGDEDVKNLKMPILDLKGVVSVAPGTAVPDMILGEDFLRAHHVLFSTSQQSFYLSYVGGSVFNMDVTAHAASAPAAPAPAASPAMSSPDGTATPKQ